MIFHEEINVSDIWFSDEAHFYLDVYVNKQNWRFWGSENPYLVVERSLQSTRITVWVALSSQDIIGPIPIDGNITANLYTGILEDSFVPSLQEIQNIVTEWIRSMMAISFINLFRVFLPLASVPLFLLTSNYTYTFSFLIRFFLPI